MGTAPWVCWVADAAMQQCSNAAMQRCSDAENRDRRPFTVKLASSADSWVTVNLRRKNQPQTEHGADRFRLFLVKQLQEQTV